MIKLFIVGFPCDMEESELAEFFNVYGEVGKVTIVTDKETGESQGYGFLTMTDHIGADRAIAGLNGATIDERQISVRIAETKPAISSKVFTSEPVKLPVDLNMSKSKNQPSRKKRKSAPEGNFKQYESSTC